MPFNTTPTRNRLAALALAGLASMFASLSCDGSSSDDAGACVVEEQPALCESDDDCCTWCAGAEYYGQYVIVDGECACDYDNHLFCSPGHSEDLGCTDDTLPSVLYFHKASGEVFLLNQCQLPLPGWERCDAGGGPPACQCEPGSCILHV